MQDVYRLVPLQRNSRSQNWTFEVAEYSDVSISGVELLSLFSKEDVP